VEWFGRKGTAKLKRLSKEAIKKIIKCHKELGKLAEKYKCNQASLLFAAIADEEFYKRKVKR